jgi:hypothetical protein
MIGSDTPCLNLAAPTVAPAAAAGLLLIGLDGARRRSLHRRSQMA